MIVCTCDHCGKVTENWFSLMISFRDGNWKRDICYDCSKEIMNLTKEFIDSITVTNNDTNK